MCAACNPGEVHAATAHAVDKAADAVGSAPAAQPGTKFAALRDPSCRNYLGGSLLSMMADNVEHVISEYRTVDLLT
jgi:hypothetical protein